MTPDPDSQSSVAISAAIPSNTETVVTKSTRRRSDPRQAEASLRSDIGRLRSRLATLPASSRLACAGLLFSAAGDTVSELERDGAVVVSTGTRDPAAVAIAGCSRALKVLGADTLSKMSAQVSADQNTTSDIADICRRITGVLGMLLLAQRPTQGLAPGLDAPVEGAPDNPASPLCPTASPELSTEAEAASR